MFRLSCISHDGRSIVWTIILVTFTLFVGFDLFRPAVTSYLSNIAGKEQGFISGMNSMFTSMANIAGPIIGGFLFDININYPYYFAAFIMVLGIMLSMIWKNPLVNQKNNGRPVFLSLNYHITCRESCDEAIHKMMIGLE